VPPGQGYEAAQVLIRIEATSEGCITLNPDPPPCDEMDNAGTLWVRVDGVGVICRFRPGGEKSTTLRRENRGQPRGNHRARCPVAPSEVAHLQADDGKGQRLPPWGAAMSPSARPWAAGGALPLAPDRHRLASRMIDRGIFFDRAGRGRLDEDELLGYLLVILRLHACGVRKRDFGCKSGHSATTIEFAHPTASRAVLR
jgi:hypothetical protein